MNLRKRLTTWSEESPSATFLGFLVAAVLLFAVLPYLLLIVLGVWFFGRIEERRVRRELLANQEYVVEQEDTTSHASTTSIKFTAEARKVADPLADLGDDPFVMGPESLRQERCPTCRKGWVLYDQNNTVLTSCRVCH